MLLHQKETIPSPHFKPRGCFMNLPVFFLLFSLALLCALCWSHRGPAQSRAEASVHSRLPCVLKPRCPDDCPACRLASTASSGAGPVPAPVRPWREVKSRRGAPKRINTEGFACPNRECLYFGITESHIHALVGDGKHGQAERIQTFRGPACHTTFSARRHTPLYRLKTPSRAGSLWCGSRTGRRDGRFRRRTSLRLLSGHHHHVAHSRRRAR